jgi:hypothetical protein
MDQEINRPTTTEASVDTLTGTVEKLNKAVSEIHGLIFPQQERNPGPDIPSPASVIDSAKLRIDRDIEDLYEVRNVLRKI